MSEAVAQSSTNESSNTTGHIALAAGGALLGALVVPALEGKGVHVVEPMIAGIDVAVETTSSVLSAAWGWIKGTAAPWVMDVAVPKVSHFILDTAPTWLKTSFYPPVATVIAPVAPLAIAVGVLGLSYYAFKGVKARRNRSK